MTRTKMTISALAGLALATVASATIVPFTESFATDNSNWRNFNGGAGLAWQAAGGPDGSSYVSASVNFTSAAANSFVNFARGQQAYGSSNSAFVGNWIADGVTTLSFDIRHDASVAIGFFARVANPNNFPGAAIVSFVPVGPGQWSHITLDVSPTNPGLFLEGAPFAAVFGNVGNIQLGLTVPSQLGNTNTDVNFDIDNISIVPAPSALAMAGMGVLALRRRR